MSQVDIRLCATSERDSVMAFLNEHWSTGHVMATHTGLFDWQHASVDRAGYDYVLAWRGAELLGVLGYIATGRYDADLADRNTVWLSLWKVRDDCGVAGLGLALLRFLTETVPHSWLGVVGIEHSHPPMYRGLRFRTGELKQYVLFNPTVEPRLAPLPRGFVTPAIPRGEASLSSLDAEALASLDVRAIAVDAIPTKSARYFQARFLEHPFFAYTVYAIERGGRPVALMAARVLEESGSRALRVVDYWGSLHHLRECGTALLGEVQRSGCEYADLWAAVPDTAPLHEAGFHTVDPDGALVVPNYFEPFERRNVRILYAFKGPLEHRVFRADGDQDRPNRLPPE